MFTAGISIADQYGDAAICLLVAAPGTASKEQYKSFPPINCNTKRSASETTDGMTFDLKQCLK